jgi:hypothetical protein
VFTLTICLIILNVTMEFVLIYRPHPVCVSNPFVASQDTILSLVNIPHEGPTYMSCVWGIMDVILAMRERLFVNRSLHSFLYLCFVDDER